MNKATLFGIIAVLASVGWSFSPHTQAVGFLRHDIQERRVLINPQPDANGNLFLPPFSVVIFSNTSYQLKGLDLVDGTEVYMNNTEIVLDSTYNGEAFLRARNVSKFIMRNSAIRSPNARSTVFLTQANVIDIRESTFEGIGYSDEQNGPLEEEGIILQGNGKLTFVKNRVENSAAVGIIGKDPTEYMVDPIVEENTILNMDYNGFIVRHVEGGSFARNTINDVEFHRAFMVMGTNNSTFDSNVCGDEITRTATFPGGGCVLMGNSNNNTLSNNIVYGGKHGIGLTGNSSGILVQRNKIYNVGQGYPELPHPDMSEAIAILETVTNSMIIENTIEDSHIGVWLYNALPNTFVRNNFLNFSDGTEFRYNFVIGHAGGRGPFNENYWGKATCEEAKQTVYDLQGRQVSVLMDSILLDPYDEATNPNPDILPCNEQRMFENRKEFL